MLERAKRNQQPAWTIDPFPGPARERGKAEEPLIFMQSKPASARYSQLGHIQQKYLGKVSFQCPAVRRRILVAYAAAAVLSKRRFGTVCCAG